jgi:hypothetical protein
MGHDHIIKKGAMILLYKRGLWVRVRVRDPVIKKEVMILL